MLSDAGIEFEELVLNRDYTDRTLRAVADATSYPQVFIDGKHIGGADELETGSGRQQAGCIAPNRPVMRPAGALRRRVAASILDRPIPSIREPNSGHAHS